VIGLADDRARQARDVGVVRASTKLPERLHPPTLDRERTEAAVELHVRDFGFAGRSEACEIAVDRGAVERNDREAFE
jgi:hypothetical protein